MSRLAWAWASGLFAIALAAGSAGCSTEAFCFDNCGEPKASTTATGAGGQGGSLTTVSGSGGDCEPFCSTTAGTGGGGGCDQTNGGVEICDDVDNDCNGQVDDLLDLDLSAPKSCGTCDNNCYTTALFCDPLTITCTPSADPGNVPGTCVCGACSPPYYDLDNDNLTCEYYCPTFDPNATESICDGDDNDCDGTIDEDVDACTSLTDCGGCGHNCVVVHGTPDCENDGQMPCDPSNTHCKIDVCDCSGPGDCWWDLDNSYATGCEYQCDVTNGGVEICGDGLDNDCDGKIDDADDLSGDPQIGVVCYGDPDGECATPAHAGTTICQGNQVVCSGPNVQVENQVLEICNAKDDDCDGALDDSPTDVGSACGLSNIFPCSFGTEQCQNGALVCIGAVDPVTETCNGVDDNCDGNINKVGNQPPSDSIGPCNVPVPPPPGATSPCVAGTKACTAGVINCVGDVGPSGPTDTCGVDANCDGQLTNQPNTQTDVKNCGSCGNDCTAGAVHANWGCSAGVCQFLGCQQGYYDLNNDQKCEYACTFVQAQEACNGIDDNCNGQTDEGVVSPSPVQVCGVNPAASSAECTSLVTVTCQGGTWVCGFPAGVCSPNCASAVEICDGLDNDCDSNLNENVGNYGKACASDDGLPPPGDGACRTTGTFVCSGPNATVCSAVKANCMSLPGGCTELCDGVDNDCDGVVDETFNAKGSNATNFVKPVATKVSANRWIYTYEASRPSATNVSPGTGNGYYCTGGACVGVPVAPAGETLDKTRACSAPAKLPWFNVNPIEVEQTCQAMGGFVCATTDYQTACTPNAACTFGYNPRGGAGSACATGFVAGSKYCNLGPSYDFAPLTAGDQDGLLPTGSNLLQNCWADWSNLQGNVAATNKLFDLTGNLREITKSAANTYPLMGGAFDTSSEPSAACSFTFYTVDQNFKLFDLGFRCCFSADPTL